MININVWPVLSYLATDVTAQRPLRTYARDAIILFDCNLLAWEISEHNQGGTLRFFSRAATQPFEFRWTASFFSILVITKKIFEVGVNI